MLRDLKSSVRAVVVLTLVLGLAIPALFTGFAQLAFSSQADGSLIKVDGKVVGSRLAAQSFTKTQVGRPSPTSARRILTSRRRSGRGRAPS
jgi:potassium-transporting ATPase KdpC subunit